MVTGALPFPGKEPFTVIAAVARGTFKRASQIAAVVSPELDQVIARCLHTTPGERYPSARALADELRAMARDSGLGEELPALRQFLDDPDAFEGTLRPRVADAAVARARQHVRRRGLGDPVPERAVRMPRRFGEAAMRGFGDLHRRERVVAVAGPGDIAAIAAAYRPARSPDFIRHRGIDRLERDAQIARIGVPVRRGRAEADDAEHGRVGQQGLQWRALIGHAQRRQCRRCVRAWNADQRVDGKRGIRHCPVQRVRGAVGGDAHDTLRHHCRRRAVRSWKPYMGMQTPAESELAELLVSSLNLENVKAVDIDPEAALFGSDLGLDSIDALELALAVSKRYGFALRSDNADNKRIFASLRNLSEHIQQHRPQ